MLKRFGICGLVSFLPKNIRFGSTGSAVSFSGFKPVPGPFFGRTAKRLLHMDQAGLGTGDGSTGRTVLLTLAPTTLIDMFILKRSVGNSTHYYCQLHQLQL